MTFSDEMLHRLLTWHRCKVSGPLPSLPATDPHMLCARKEKALHGRPVESCRRA